MRKTTLAGVLLVIALVIVFNVNSIISSKLAKSQSASSSSPANGPHYTRSVLAYGKNDHGQLSGNTSIENVHAMTDIKSPFDIVEIYAGRAHSIALTKNGDVISWGQNDAGELGYETANQDSPLPQKIEGLKDIVSLSTTNNHSLALDRDGKVWAWGQNFTGQLGNGNRDDRFSPIQVDGLPIISRVSAGHKFSLALSTDGEVWAWGASCDASAVQEAKTLLETFGSNIMALQGGYYDSASSGGSAYDLSQDCLNEEAIKIKSLTPVKLPAKDIVRISAGYGHGLLLTKGGEVIAFGCNLYGQAGHEPGTRKGEWLTTVNELKDIVSIAAGARHSLALDKNGTVYTFGAPFLFGTSFEGESESSLPKKIDGIPPIERIFAGFDYSIAIAKDGTVWTWWRATVADLLIPDLSKRVYMPLKISDTPPKHIATGGTHIIFEY